VLFKDKPWIILASSIQVSLFVATTSLFSATLRHACISNRQPTRTNTLFPATLLKKEQSDTTVLPNDSYSILGPILGAMLGTAYIGFFFIDKYYLLDGFGLDYFRHSELALFTTIFLLYPIMEPLLLIFVKRPTALPSLNLPSSSIALVDDSTDFLYDRTFYIEF
jgi:hypothetical protein